jgi:hypothetical protein
MRLTLTAAATALLASSAAVSAQEEQVLLSVDGELGDYGIDALEDVRHGRVALVHDPAGVRLALHFLRDEAPAQPPPPSQPPPPELAPGDDRSPQVRALWVWNTDQLLVEPTERVTFLDFVAEQRIERVFLYVPAAEGQSPAAGYLPFDGDRLAPLLADLHARGASTYALDGDRDYVHPENHEGVLRTVRRVVEHNRTHRPEEQFYGVRYDIEPYLIAGFQGPRQREILDNYVQLLARVAEVAHAGGVRVGADIPFWFDAGDEITGSPFEAELNGRVAPVLEHVMASVDDIGIMAYRTTVDGPNGVLLHSRAEIDLGNRGNAQVYVGVETTHIYDEDLYTLRGPGRTGLPPLPDARWIVAEELEGGEVRLSLVEGQEMLDELAARATDLDGLRYWFAGQPVPLPGDLISFHALGADAMWQTASEIERNFGSQPSYLGLAFHDYRGLRELLAR